MVFGKLAQYSSEPRLPCMQVPHSTALFERASKAIPGGVNSPVRSFNGVGGTPRFMQQGKGAYLIDADGNTYVDYVLSWGPLLLGHAHPKLLDAIYHTAANGTSFGTATELEICLAEKIKQLMPNLELVRMVGSGTEAAMSVLRLARAYTKRNKILKFSGCYHGHVDALLVKAGSGAQTFGFPTSPGIPECVIQDTLVAQFNNITQVQQLFHDFGADIAAVIVEPVAGNMNCVLPVPGFLENLRELCTQHGSVLIFDEVMCGFRVGLGGAQAKYNITPDLTMLGKVIGGGLPAAAYGGKKEIMSLIAPTGPVYQAGTLSGNPLAMAAGIVMLDEISQPGFYERIRQQTEKLCQGFVAIAATHHLPLQIAMTDAMFGFFFYSKPVHDLETASLGDIEFFRKFYHGMLNHGVYLPPSMYEACFISNQHHDAEITKTLQAFDQTLAQLHHE
jgi:glutamate-1-semialdehyde 2,1-aminomutase